MYLNIPMQFKYARRDNVAQKTRRAFVKRERNLAYVFFSYK